MSEPAGEGSARTPEEGGGWHLRPAGEVAAVFGTDPVRGLASSEAASRLASDGPNVLRPREPTPPWRLFVGQYDDFMIWVLFAAVAISAFEGQAVDAVAIATVLILNGVLGFVQEYRAERAMAALQELASPSATVVREGAERRLAAGKLVRGDVVLLAAGDKVPADGRLLEAASLRVDESTLTGESRPASKVVEPLLDPEASLGDRANLVFAGTTVAVGRGRFVVTGTGQATEMGHIADLLAEQEEEPTPLQRELRTVGQRIAAIVLAIAGVIFLANAVQAGRVPGESIASHLSTALLVAISLAVAAIPEGLPAIVTVALSLGVRKMAERHAIVRKLHAVETLGATTFICSDKTGTLTRNEMTVRRLVVGDVAARVSADWTIEPEAGGLDEADLAFLLRAAASCNDTRVAADGSLTGDPTETALMTAAERLSADRVRPPRVGEVPFDSARKRMTTVHDLGGGERVAYMKGAPDVVLRLCAAVRLHGSDTPLDETLLGRLEGMAETSAAAGFRMLAVAARALADGEPNEGEEIEHDFVFLGLAGMVDPPRDEVPAAIAECHRAGIRVAMVTGDHALTAQAVGSEIGLLEGREIVTGAQLECMSDDELRDRVEGIRIYARVDPEHKLRIVDALKRRGEIVAVTGDGVNDAPALKRADIGVAMGRIGTDVSREAADMILADDDFSTIVAAVREGRAVFANLRKSILFLLSCNISEVLIVFITTFLSPVPALRPLQLLWINFITDGLPALALGVDPAAPDVMDRGPRKADQGILTRATQFDIAWQGALITVAGLSMYVYADRLMPGHGAATAQTMLFTTMVLAQLIHAFNFRSETRSVFSAESLRNPWLLLSLLGSLALQSLAIYVPALQRIFGTAPLSAFDWLVLLVAALLPTVIIDAVKVARARRAAA